MEKKQIPAAVRFLPALAWYALIFWFSSRPAPVSGGQSGRLIGLLLGAVSPSCSASPELQAFAVETLSFPVRKAAHMFLYFILALLLLHALTRSGLLTRERLALLTPALCAALAALDEYHQTLVPGRSGEPQDVLVDLCGALLALGFWALVLFWGGRRRTAPAWLTVLPFLLLAALILFPQWAELAAAALAGARVPEEAVPIFREAMSGAALGLLGAWVWIAGCLAGRRVRAALGALALGTCLPGALPFWTAAAACGAGWALAAALWGFILRLGDGTRKHID